MVFASWRGTAGVIKPTYRPGGLEELIRLLPDGIAVIPRASLPAPASALIARGETTVTGTTTARAPAAAGSKVDARLLAARGQDQGAEQHRDDGRLLHVDTSVLFTLARFARAASRGCAGRPPGVRVLARPVRPSSRCWLQ